MRTLHDIDIVWLDDVSEEFSEERLYMKEKTRLQYAISGSPMHMRGLKDYKTI